MYANDNSESHITSGKLQLHPIHICKNSSKEKNRRYHYIFISRPSYHFTRVDFCNNLHCT